MKILFTILLIDYNEWIIFNILLKCGQNELEKSLG